MRVRSPLATLDVVCVAQDHKNPGHLQTNKSACITLAGSFFWGEGGGKVILQGRASPRNGGVFRKRCGRYWKQQLVSRGVLTGVSSRPTYFRTHGKALMMEMMIKMFVMIPLTITAGCCTA